jgi:hypothetical protein
MPSKSPERLPEFSGDHLILCKDCGYRPIYLSGRCRSCSTDYASTGGLAPGWLPAPKAEKKPAPDQSGPVTVRCVDCVARTNGTLCGGCRRSSIIRAAAEALVKENEVRRRNMELVEQNHELQAKKARRAAACDCGAASIKDLTHATWCSSHV